MDAMMKELEEAITAQAPGTVFVDPELGKWYSLSKALKAE